MNPIVEYVFAVVMVVWLLILSVRLRMLDRDMLELYSELLSLKQKITERESEVDVTRK